MPRVDRGVPLFACGVLIMCVEFACMFFSPDRETLQALGLKGLGLGTPVGVGLCVLSGPVGRRSRAKAGDR